MKWQSQDRILYRNATIHSTVSPFATAMLVDGDHIAWLGEESAVAAHHDSADRVLDMDGAFIAPVFVDSHSSALNVHETSDARSHAAEFGIGAFHDFSSTDCKAVEELVLSAAGSLVYSFRNQWTGFESGLVVSVHELQALPALLRHGVPIAVDGHGSSSSFVVSELLSAAQMIGSAAFKAATVRIEGVDTFSEAELIDLEQIGVTIIGHPDEMKTAASAVAVGGSVTFGSYSDEFENPWAAIRAAVFEFPHHERMTARAAFSAATRGGWRAVGRGHIGVIAPGAPAHFAFWDTSEVVVQTPDERVAGWSTDPRSGTPGLPDVSPGLPLPTCLRTVIAGTVVFDRGSLAS
ncbi:MAG: amidohydrolase family protein [Candidatus Nanopelagicales bacterium]|nr:amidohydrolase family protein [Candidatus Nanopelagicales bacterium]